MKRILILTLLLCLVFIADSPLAAEISLSERLTAMEDGSMVFSFETKPGVYSRGERITFCESDSRPDPGWEEGPCHLRLRFRDGELRDVDVRIGSTAPSIWDGAVDLGSRDPAEAAEALLELARKGEGRALEELIVPAVMARDVVIWPTLLALAKDQSRPDELRESAVFWLGHEAGQAAAAGLEKILADEDEDLEIREQAIFALSQRSIDECFPTLSRVATSSPHPQLREQALFWLARHDDPRVLNLIENILIGN